jgi:hypothetical protein
MSQEEFIEELKLMDDLVTGERRGDSLHSFISESIPSGPLQQLSDEEAESALKAALAQLALRSVAVHVCEHYSARDALHYLRTVVADEGEYYPGLKGSSFVQNYMTSEGCPACEAEFEKDYEERDAKIRRMMQEDESEGPDNE